MRYVFSAFFFFLASSGFVSAADAPSFPDWKAAGVSAADAKQVETAYMFFAALPQQPFKLILARGGQGLPEEDAQAERLLCLRKATAVALRYPKHAKEILAPFETLLLAERDGKPLVRKPTQGQIDSQTDLAEELFSTREKLRAPVGTLPTVSAAKALTLQEFDRGRANIFFGKSDGSLKIFPSVTNTNETEAARKVYWLAPDAELVEVAVQKDGSYLVQLRFANFTKSAREMAAQYPAAKEAVLGQWLPIGVEKIELREGADGAALVRGERETSAQHGVVYSFRVSAAQMRKATGDNELHFSLVPAVRFEGRKEEVRLEGSAVLPKK